MKTATILLSLTLAAVPAAGQVQTTIAAPPASAPAQHTTTMEVRPAAPSIPALRYHLLPDPSEQVSGNAAPIYLIAFQTFIVTPQDQQAIDAALSEPLTGMDSAAVNQVLSRHAHLLHEMEIAARRDRCEWDLPYREDGLETLLPHLQRCRQAAQILSLQARVQIVGRKYDDAVQTLQSGFALVNHLQNDAGLIQEMVRAAISGLLMDRVSELQQAGGPNLYWALANLPHNMFDIRPSVMLERNWIWYALPELRDKKASQLSVIEVRSLFDRVRHLSNDLGEKTSNAPDAVRFLAQMTQDYATAKTWLAAHGYSPEQIQEMPVGAALAAYFVADFQESADEMFKWTLLPYPQAREKLGAAQRRLGSRRQEENPLLVLVPSLSRGYFVLTRAQRRIAFAQCVDALRAYAAAHEGKLPATLADLTETPAPSDPMTGKPFTYALVNATARLESNSPPDAGEPGEVVEMRIENAK